MYSLGDVYGNLQAVRNAKLLSFGDDEAEGEDVSFVKGLFGAVCTTCSHAAQAASTAATTPSSRTRN